MSSWRKCYACSRVMAVSEFDDRSIGGPNPTCRSCEGKPTAAENRGKKRTSVQAYRERTGNAYGKAYEKAKRAATKELIARYPEEYAQLFDEARRSHGLGPTRSG